MFYMFVLQRFATLNELTWTVIKKKKNKQTMLWFQCVVMNRIRFHSKHWLLFYFKIFVRCQEMGFQVEECFEGGKKKEHLECTLESIRSMPQKERRERIQSNLDTTVIQICSSYLQLK